MPLIVIFPCAACKTAPNNERGPLHTKIRSPWITAYLIVESLCHADSTSWEVWIIILSFPQSNSCRSITVASQKGKYVVLKETYD